MIAQQQFNNRTVYFEFAVGLGTQLYTMLFSYAQELNSYASHYAPGSWSFQLLNYAHL